MLVLLVTSAAGADERELLKKIEQLEIRIRDLEANQPPPPVSSTPSSWTERVRLGGSVETGFYGGQENAIWNPDSFQIWDARLFVDADLGRAVTLGERTIFRNIAMTFEWDIVRTGSLRNNVGELYGDFQGMLGNDMLNFQVGRFQIPVGEAYLRYSQGTARDPFVSNPVGGPWWWDEGVRFYGSTDDHVFGFVSSISDGDTSFNRESSSGKQQTLKLYTRPLPWLYASVSALRTGKLGSSSSSASGALWLGESWARAFGAGTGVPSFQDGVSVPDGPNKLSDTWLVAGDVILDFEGRVRLWLAYGRYEIDSTGGSFYDRVLHYWIAEAVFRGAWVSEILTPFYVGLRADALGTYDPDEGYLLDSRRAGTLGYNMESLTAYSAVLGWDLTRNVRLRAEYSHRDIDLVDGVTSAMRSTARNNDSFAVEVGMSF